MSLFHSLFFNRDNLRAPQIGGIVSLSPSRGDTILCLRVESKRRFRILWQLFWRCPRTRAVQISTAMWINHICVSHDLGCCEEPGGVWPCSPGGCLRVCRWSLWRKRASTRGCWTSNRGITDLTLIAYLLHFCEHAVADVGAWGGMFLGGCWRWIWKQQQRQG